LNVTAGQSGIVIANNYIISCCLDWRWQSMLYIACFTSSLEVSNNIFFGGINVANAIVQNNFFNTCSMLYLHPLL
jgi:hypothetical protein